MASAAPGRFDAPVVALAGALHALAFAPQPSGGLQLACIALLAWRVGAAPSAARAAWLGGLFGTAWLGAGVWWLFISLHRYGGLPAWLSALAVALLCAFLSIYLAGATAAWWRLRRGRPFVDALGFAALWLLAELARGLVFTGFPWLASGYAQVDSRLAALAPWIGVYGLGAVVAYVAALLAVAFGRAAWRVRATAGAAALAVVGVAGLLPRDFTTPTGTLRVALLQGNVPQNEKFSPQHQPEALDWTLRTLVAAPAELVVAPETAIPLLPAQLPQGLWDALRGSFADGRRAALVGLPLGDFESGYTNSVAGLSADAATKPGGFYRYDKQHLVPFGEFIPFGFRWFVDMMNMPLGDFDRGPLAAPSFEVRGEQSVERVGPNVCYEDLFGEELAARFRDPSRAPTMLANLSNIAWFGDTVAIAQHLQISRMRTLELQRPMLRATNTGATAVIDHRGVVTHALPPHTRGVLDATVQGREGPTPYARWAAVFGLWPLVAAALVIVAALGLRRP